MCHVCNGQPCPYSDTSLVSDTAVSVLIGFFLRFDLYFYYFVQFSSVQLQKIYLFIYLTFTYFPSSPVLRDLCALGLVLQPTLHGTQLCSTLALALVGLGGLIVLGPCAKRVIVTPEPSMISGWH